MSAVHRLWPNEGLPGALSRVLRTPEHIMQALSLVSREQLARSVVCGPDAGRHVDAARTYVAAGFDGVYVSQIGPNQDEFFEFYGKEILPELRRR